MPEYLSSFAARIAPLLGNHLWQSTLVAILAALMAILLRANRASVRYGIWLAASVKFLVPFSLLMSISAHWPMQRATVIQPPTAAHLAITLASQPFDAMLPVTLSNHPAGPLETLATRLPEVLVAAWVCGSLTVLLVWYRRWRQVLRTWRKASPTGDGREVEILRRLERCSKVRRPITVFRSKEMMEPGIFGIFRPVLLWPERLNANLEDQHIEAILAHELAHAKRYDNLTASIHMLVEAIFWFHPIVWWMESRMLRERESACDEAVTQSGVSPDVYAESLLRACRFCLESPLVCVSGIAGADLRNRIVRIATSRHGARLSFARRILLAAAAGMVFALPMSFGLMDAMQAQWSLLHSTASPRPAFEVATIKPSRDTDMKPGMQMGLSPSNFTVSHASIEELIEFAYNVNSKDQVQGEPDWITAPRFDIQAKASDAVIAEVGKLPPMQQVTQIRLMLQSLLADRFQLKVSFETKEIPVYALVVATGGPKFKEGEADPLPPPGTRPRLGARGPSIGRTGQNQYTATAWDMRSTADFLSHFDEVGHRAVVDETGLKGRYDFVLNNISVGPSPDGSTTSIFTALQEQLGLKLVARKAPVEVLVVNQIQRPSEN